MHRTLDLDVSSRKEIRSKHGAAVNWLAVDRAEARYMLSASSDAMICLYDLQEDRMATELSTQVINPLHVIPRAHNFVISCVEWYPHDTGMFISSSNDNSVKAWDTNVLKDVGRFDLGSLVYNISMSPVATHHCLVAAACRHQDVRLCDIAIGSITHTLKGHREAAWAVRWSPVDQYLLATASCDHTIRMWDIRRAGWLMCLDQYSSPSPYAARSSSAFADDIDLEKRGKFSVSKRTSSAQVATAHNGSINSLCFTPDGRYLISSGNDLRVRLWDILTGTNTLVNYPPTKHAHQKAIELAVSSNGQVLYMPNGLDVHCLDVQTGKVQSVLRGHYENVSCCAFHPQIEELYSSGFDKQILVWSPQERLNEHFVSVDDEVYGRQLLEEDAWSEDEEEEGPKR